MALLGILAVVTGCTDNTSTNSDGRKRIVVTYSILGSLVKAAVGDRADVVVMMPNGADPHEWEPSAKDIEQLNKADLIVRNGLGLEGGMLHALDQAKKDGVATFVASDHITVRTVGQGEGVPTGDPDQTVGAKDPHLWMDPLTLKDVITALGPALTARGIDASTGIATVTADLVRLNDEVSGILAVVPDADRKLVTGHESLGYFATRYRFTLIGAIVPSLTTQAGASAAALSQLAAKVRQQGVKAVFTEIGTPPQVAEAIGSETGVKVVDLATHNLPADGKYSTFLTDDARRIAAALA
ncbi:MAG: metal ABC transporter substrate-binding protein [Ilumatobacteraceae bacterium]